jgi:hypothetical protein
VAVQGFTLKNVWGRLGARFKFVGCWANIGYRSFEIFFGFAVEDKRYAMKWLSLSFLEDGPKIGGG